MPKKTTSKEDYLAPEDDWDLPVEVRLAALAKNSCLDSGPRAAQPASEKPNAARSTPSQPQTARREERAGGQVGSEVDRGPALSGESPTNAANLLALPHRKRLDYFPAFAARTGLFQAGRGGGPRTPETVKSPRQYDLAFEGESLTMRDKAIWEACIQIAKGADDVVPELKVSLSDIGRRIGAPNDGGRALDSIWASLQKLAGARVALNLGASGRASGRMLADARREDGACWIRLDAAFMTRILSEDTQFKMDASRRAAIKSLLGQWLHDYLSTHSAAYKDGLGMGHLRGLCGHPGAARRFPAAIRSALAEIAAAAPGMLQSFRIEQETLNGETWKLHIVRGDEMPAFEMPKLRAAPLNAKGPRKGGVSL